jgi:hypothetical protein
VLTLHGTRIADLTAFLIPAAFERFGLLDELHAGPSMSSG